MKHLKVMLPISALFLAGNAFAAMPQAVCDAQKKNSPAAYQALVQSGSCNGGGESVQSGESLAKGLNVEYNPELMLYAGQFSVQKDINEAKGVCKRSGGRLMQATEVHDYIAKGELKMRTGTPRVVAEENNKLTVTGDSSTSWGELICAKEAGNSEATQFKNLNKVTFRESQDYCLSQGQWLLDEENAKARIMMIAQGVKNKTIKLENTLSRSQVPQLYLAYANSQQDYGYVGANASPFIPLPIGKVRVKAINGTKGGQHTVMSTQDGAVHAIGQTDYLGLDKYPTEYHIVMTQQGKMSGSKDDYFYVFGACGSQGNEIKDSQ